MSVEALEPSSEVAELPNKPLKKQKQKIITRGPYLVQFRFVRSPVSALA